MIYIQTILIDKSIILISTIVELKYYFDINNVMKIFIFLDAYFRKWVIYEDGRN